MWFFRGENDPIRKIEYKIVYITGIAIQNGEDLKVVCCQKGGYYKEHWDYFDTNHTGNIAVLASGGHRIITVMIYLNTVHDGEGGETYFPRIDLRARPEQGKAMIKLNIDRKGKQDEKSIHSG